MSGGEVNDARVYSQNSIIVERIALFKYNVYTYIYAFIDLQDVQAMYKEHE